MNVRTYLHKTIFCLFHLKRNCLVCWFVRFCLFVYIGIGIVFWGGVGEGGVCVFVVCARA
jgi:hypothetical protein